MKLDNAKTFRLLNLYERLNRGETVNKKDFANAFGISEKSVQRDIDDLRCALPAKMDTKKLQKTK